MREGISGASRLAWVRVWGTFTGLLLLTLLVAYWLWQPRPSRPTSTARTGMATMSPTSATSAAPARVIPAGFMRAPSGHLLPRFVSLATANARVRTGPGAHYPIAWIIKLAGMPLEVLAEANGYWRVRDAEGAEGWIAEDRLAATRTALVAPWNPKGRHALRARPDDAAPLRAWLASGVLVRVNTCNGRWCNISVNGAHGWVRQEQLWGVYAGERIGTIRETTAP